MTTTNNSSSMYPAGYPSVRTKHLAQQPNKTSPKVSRQNESINSTAHENQLHAQNIKKSYSGLSEIQDVSVRGKKRPWSAKNPLLRPKFMRNEQSTPQLVGDDIINIQNIISEENHQNNNEIFHTYININHYYFTLFFSPSSNGFISGA